jgi:hypothetical protein
MLASRTILLTLLAAAGATACGGTTTTTPRTTTPPPRAEHVAAHGLAVTLPQGWVVARRSLTPNLTDPRERLTVATFPLRYRPGSCAHLPVSGLERIGAGGALVTIQERLLGHSTRGFPRRPARFAATLGGPSEASACVPGVRFEDHWFSFADHGRRFHVEVAFGPHATVATRRQAWAILDGLRVGPLS